MIKTIVGDRIVAFLKIGNKMYQSDCDHQDCLEQYFEDNGIKSPYNYENDESKEEAVSKTFGMKCNHTAYGFDLFDAQELDYVLLAHDKQTFDSNYEWIMEYSKENNTRYGYFLNATGYEVEIVA